MAQRRRAQAGDIVRWGKLLKKTDKRHGHHVVYIVECTICKKKLLMPIHKLRENDEHRGCFRFIRDTPSTRLRRVGIQEATT